MLCLLLITLLFFVKSFEARVGISRFHGLFFELVVQAQNHLVEILDVRLEGENLRIRFSILSLVVLLERFVSLRFRNALHLLRVYSFRNHHLWTKIVLRSRSILIHPWVN